MINRIVIVGNGFDKAHNLKTGYEDFFYWYWEDVMNRLIHSDYMYEVSDELCTIILKDQLYPWYVYLMQTGYTGPLHHLNGKEFYSKLKKDKNCEIVCTPFFERICKSVETKNWVDIENVYYAILCDIVNGEYNLSIDELNNELAYLKEKLVEYLTNVKTDFKDSKIEDIITAPVKSREISTKAKEIWYDFKRKRSEWNDDNLYDYINKYFDFEYLKKTNQLCKIKDDVKKEIELCRYDDFESNLIDKPDNIFVLNFNYTDTVERYLPNNSVFRYVHIHGELSNPNSVIFGYGDELDENFKEIENLNDGRFLENVKSIKYLESSNYRKLMEFMNFAPYQVIIMGHSCGNSDRTLLNALFEHENCISIKPYYYVDKDGNNHYTEIVQNIYRNFTNKANFRDKVVNIDYCEPMSQMK